MRGGEPRQCGFAIQAGKAAEAAIGIGCGHEISSLIVWKCLKQQGMVADFARCSFSPAAYDEHLPQMKKAPNNE